MARSAVGGLLQHWRNVRGLSQLALASRAEVSSRHLSFVETGRSSPSREMVLLLGRALDVPLRERNALLLAAGYAPVYLETRLDAPELGPVRLALDAILRQQEPYPALVLDRHWEILRTNDAAARFSRFFLGERAGDAPRNLLRRVFDPRAMRPYIANWDQVAEVLLQRVQREAVGGVPDERTRSLLAELLTYPGVPRASTESDGASDRSAAALPVVPVVYARGEERFTYFSTVTTLGTPQDITLQEIRIECFFPANAETDHAARALAARDGR